jgi:hypothetical protein
LGEEALTFHKRCLNDPSQAYVLFCDGARGASRQLNRAAISQARSLFHAASIGLQPARSGAAHSDFSFYLYLWSPQSDEDLYRRCSLCGF